MKRALILALAAVSSACGTGNNPANKVTATAVTRERSDRLQCSGPATLGESIPGVWTRTYGRDDGKEIVKMTLTIGQDSVTLTNDCTIAKKTGVATVKVKAKVSSSQIVIDKGDSKSASNLNLCQAAVVQGTLNVTLAGPCLIVERNGTNIYLLHPKDAEQIETPVPAPAVASEPVPVMGMADDGSPVP